ncbi:hypothetical protein E0H72_28850 [Rhizobium leguminosarum bv. viciae]|nr:hypothetical protein E0H72_28850 [Rhizobium leguminosarum bv. viciae]
MAVERVLNESTLYRFVFTQFRTQNRYTVSLELLKSDPDPPTIPAHWKTSWPILSACFCRSLA